MASSDVQGSKAVLIVIVLLKLFLSTDAIDTLSKQQLGNILKQQNKAYELTDTIAEKEDLEHTISNVQSHQNQTGSEYISVQQRSEPHTDWHCSSHTNWRDLGNQRYPRFVKEVLCLGESCLHGFYSCRSQNYSIRVLSARETGDAHEIALPWSLRQDWKFMEIQISAGCICGN